MGRTFIRSRSVRLVLLGLAVGVLAYVGYRLFFFITDDAFIAFRYINNQKLGYGLVWNPPPFQPVEGYTSWLWIVLLGWAWSLTGVDAVAIDGLTTEPARPRPEEGDDADTGAAHPNGSATVDHVVAASPDLPRTIEAFTRIGMETRRIRDTDQYGAPMRQVFFRLGRPVLELIGPPEPSGDRPASFWGLALTVGDLDATKDLLGDRLSDPKTAVQPGRRIATLRHETLGITVPVAFMSS